MTFRRKLLLRFGLAISIALVLVETVDVYLVARHTRESTEENLRNVTEAVHETVDTSYRIYQQTVNHNLNVADLFVASTSRLDPSTPIETEVENQITGEVERVSIPAFRVGEEGRVANGSTWFADEITELVGGTVTLFQLVDQGLLRISTSVKRRDGTRATGTYIPRDSPVYESIVDGEEFRGRAYVVDDWYITAYRPIRDASRQIIGAIYVGLSQQNLDLLQEALREFEVGESYYTAIADVDGNMIIHPEWAGRNIRNVAVAGARDAFEGLIRRIVEEGEPEGRIEYALGDRTRVNFYSFIPEMQWVVISGIDAAEIHAAVYDHLRTTLLLQLGVLAVVLLLILAVSANVSKPLRQLTHAAARFSRRDFDVELPEASEDEIRDLGRSFRTMARELKSFYEELEAKVERRTSELRAKNAELEEARARAEEGARAKSAFLAAMSHEIRTPMNAVIGMTTLLGSTPLTREQEECVSTIRTSGDALLGIINDILDYSKIESGKLELEFARFDLRECVEDALDLVAHTAHEKRLELAYQIENGVPTHLEGDVSRLRQIILNLLSNAVKFTERGEIVVEIDSEDRDGEGVHEIHVCVRDTGIGIAPDRIPRLFQSFSQADSSTTRRYGGTGLGLVISKRLAEAMGGTMWVESEVDAGSCFHFTVRVRESAALRKTLRDHAKVDLTDRDVLVVDDNETNRDILRRQLGLWGMRPVVVNSPRAALAHLASEKLPDVALVDFEMPEMDGQELARRLRADDGTRDMPLVLMSSSSVRPEAGLFDVEVPKPLKAQRLYEGLLAALGETSGRHVGPRLRSRPKIDDDMARRYPLHILMAEDNAINQKVAARLLDRLGYSVDIVANGEEAVDALQRQPYDLVLMDVQMPTMSGIEATRAIRASSSSTNDVYIAALSAGVLLEERESAREAGMNDFIAKPLRVEELVAVLERASAHAGTSRSSV